MIVYRNALFLFTLLLSLLTSATVWADTSSQTAICGVDNATTQFTLTNPTSQEAAVVVIYYLNDGTNAGAQALTVPDNGTRQINTATAPLPGGYAGYLIINSDQSITTTVDSTGTVLSIDFIAASTVGNAPHTTTFSEQITGDCYSGLVWDWGDGSSTTSGSMPSHTYSTVGDYDVTLSAEINGSPFTSHTKPEYIHITNTPLSVQFQQGSTAAPSTFPLPVVLLLLLATARLLIIRNRTL